jgi:L-lactate utilization protein LutC
MTENEERFTRLAEGEVVEAVADKLRERGFAVLIAQSGQEAKAKVLELLPPGSEVLTAASMTLKEIGLTEAIDESGNYQSVRGEFAGLDRQKAEDARRMRKLGAAPDWVVGSVHAITRTGEVVVASFGGSQMASYVYGAGNVIWVVGTQKIVTDLEEAFERIEQHSLPLESERLKAAAGIESHINKLLIVKGDRKGRTTIVLAKEVLGF